MAAASVEANGLFMLVLTWLSGRKSTSIPPTTVSSFNADRLCPMPSSIIASP